MKKNKNSFTDKEGNQYKLKKPFYKRWWFILIAGIIIISFVFSGEDDEEATSAASEEDTEEVAESVEEEEVEEEPEVEPIEISAYDLVTEFDNNSARADKDYKGEILKVTGYVSNVSDGGGKPYFVMAGEEDFAVTDVQIKVIDEEEQYDKIIDMDEGDEVTIIGTLKGTGLFDIEIKDAVIVE